MMTLNKQRWVRMPREDGSTSVILADIEFWHLNQAALRAWCDQHDVEFTGMVLAPLSPSIMTLFALRWS
jgi:hypothetical protein